MKTRILSLILAIILLLPALAGCDSETVPSQQTGTVAIPGNESEYPDFELPEETDTLVLYSSGLNTKALTYAVEIFKRMYPEVNVDWHKLEQDEFVTQIRAEIPAGRGPDLLYASGSDFSDVYKTMSTGIFMDFAADCFKCFQLWIICKAIREISNCCSILIILTTYRHIGDINTF